MKYGRNSYNAIGDRWFYTVAIDIFPVVQKLLSEINAQIFLISTDDQKVKQYWFRNPNLIFKKKERKKQKKNK